MPDDFFMRESGKHRDKERRMVQGGQTERGEDNWKREEKMIYKRGG